MTDKQKRFCDEYLVDCNGTRAYKAAYPNVKSDASAATASGRLLRNVEVSSSRKKVSEKFTPADIMIRSSLMYRHLKEIQ